MVISFIECTSVAEPLQLRGLTNCEQKFHVRYRSGHLFISINDVPVVDTHVNCLSFNLLHQIDDKMYNAGLRFPKGFGVASVISVKDKYFVFTKLIMKQSLV